MLPFMFIPNSSGEYTVTVGYADGARTEAEGLDEASARNMEEDFLEQRRHPLSEILWVRVD